MACTYFGPIKITDKDTLTSWVRSCSADGKMPRVAAGKKEGWIDAWCCDTFTEPVGRSAEPDEHESDYDLVLPAEAFMELLDGRTVRLSLGDEGDLALSFEKRRTPEGDGPETT